MPNIGQLQWFICGLMFLFGFLMQITVKVSFFDSVVNVSSSDFLLFILALIVMSLTLKYGLKFISFDSNLIFPLILLLLMWMVFSFFVGYFKFGYVQPWALVNKLFGFVILIFYFLFGAISAGYSGWKEKRIFLRIVFVTAACICCIDFYRLYLSAIGLEQIWRPFGLMGNPNLQGFLLSSIVIIGLSCSEEKKIFNELVDVIVIGWLISFIVLTGSRSAQIGIVVGLLTLIILKAISSKTLLKVSLCAFVFVFLCSHLETFHEFLFGEVVKAMPNPQDYTYYSRNSILSDNGLYERMLMIEEGLNLWFASPIVGIGLGTFLDFGIQNGKPVTIHNTPVWLLVETGLVGLFGFAFLFLTIVRTLLTTASPLKSRFYELKLAAIALLVCFAGASIGTELMYQRYLWFFVGWSLINTKNYLEKS